MIRYIIAAALALVATPAVAQNCDIPPNSAVAASTDKAALQAGADCLAKRIKGRQDSIVGLTAANQIDTGQRNARLARIAALNAAPPVVTPTDPYAVPAAIPSNFDTSTLISTGYRIPPTAAPDIVGAFRLICQPSPGPKGLAFVDPMVTPGVVGKSELHEFAGNTLADENSTFATLRIKGDSSCMNAINRSNYWHPALLTGDEKSVIRFNYISLYYKRLPKSDPRCLQRAKFGCINLPNGLQAKADVNHFRCATNQYHRTTLDEAIADCGGEGEILASVVFGQCWNGKTDSPDHYSHLVDYKLDQNSGQPYCDAQHPYLTPELTQTVSWSIQKTDGKVHFSAHHFHANYQLAWDQPTLDRAMANCIDKLLNCSDGDIGDGSILKRWSGFTYVATPRLVATPVRP